MQQHIQQTINYCTSEIAKLNAVYMSLIAAFGEPVSTPAPSQPAKVGRVAPRAPAAKSKKAPRRSDASEHNAAIAAKLPQPFTGVILAKALGLTKNGASSQIHRWQEAGLVKRVAFGQYERTAKFPAASITNRPAIVTAHIPIPGLDPEPKGSIAEQLEKALKDRDAATAAGQDRLAKILQDKVDKLTKQLS